MLNLFFPIFDLINNWISIILPFTVQNLFWGLIAGGLAFLIYWFLSNQKKITRVKEEMKEVRNKMFDDDLGEKSEYNKLAKQNLLLSFKLLGKIFFPAIISILPVIIIALWYDGSHSFRFPEDGESILIHTIPQAEMLIIKVEDNQFEPFQLSSIIQSNNKNDKISIFADGELIYNNFLFKNPIPYVTRENWWNLLIRSPIGYISEDSSFDAIAIDYPDKIVFPNMPKFLNGWELLFFVGIFISALPLRLIFKVQ